MTTQKGKRYTILKKTLRILLLISGALLLLNTAVMTLVASFTIGFVLQAALGASLIAYAILFHKIPRKIHVAAGAVCMVPIVLAASLWVYGNTSDADYAEDAAIVLGAGLRGEQVSPILAKRLDAAAAYSERNPGALIIVCGGLGEGAAITEAEAMRRYLVTRGVPNERIVMEGLSTSTYESLSFAREILIDYFPDGFRAVLITSDFHLYRTVSLAGGIGIPASRIGSHTSWYAWPVNYLREMLAVTYWWAFPPSGTP